MSDNTTYYEPIIHTVEEADAGRYLRDVIKSRLGISRRLMIKLKTSQEGLALNGRKAGAKDRVAAGDVIELRMTEESSDTILPQPMTLDIVFEDDHLLVINKPAGLIVHPTSGHYLNTLANGVVHHWQERGERVRFRPVHRLDEFTSGLVVIAKNQYSNQQLAAQMMAGGMTKEYRAYVFGKPPALSGEVNAPIGRATEDPHRRVVREDGASALTYYQVARTYGDGAGHVAGACDDGDVRFADNRADDAAALTASAVDIRLGTGRTHQIRVHMLHIGCPLIGDSYYSNEQMSGAPSALSLSDIVGRQALHAIRLGFDHPVTGEPMSLEAALPDDLLQLEQALAGLHHAFDCFPHAAKGPFSDIN